MFFYDFLPKTFVRVVFLMVIASSAGMSFSMQKTSPKKVLVAPIEDYFVDQPQADAVSEPEVDLDQDIIVVTKPADTDNADELIQNATSILNFDPEFEIADYSADYVQDPKTGKFNTLVTHGKHSDQIPVIYSHGFGGSKKGFQKMSEKFKAPMALFNYADARKTENMSAWWENTKNFDIGQELDARVVLYVARIMVAKGFNKLRFFCHSRGSAAVLMALYMLERPELYQADLKALGLNEARQQKLLQVMRASDFMFVHPLLDIHKVIGDKPAGYVSYPSAIVKKVWSWMPSFKGSTLQSVDDTYDTACYALSWAMDCAYMPFAVSAQYIAQLITNYKMGSTTPIKILEYFAEQKIPYRMVFYFAKQDEVVGNDHDEVVKKLAKIMNAQGAQIYVLPGGFGHNELNRIISEDDPLQFFGIPSHYGMFLHPKFKELYK